MKIHPDDEVSTRRTHHQKVDTLMVSEVLFLRTLGIHYCARVHEKFSTRGILCWTVGITSF